MIPTVHLQRGLLTAVITVYLASGNASCEPAGMVIGTPGLADPGLVVAEPQDAASHVFDPTVLRSYNLVITENDLAAIDQSPASELYVNAMLEVDGERYGPLSVRYKGSDDAFLTPCTPAVRVGSRPGKKTGKCSMKLDFDRVDPAGRFHGLKKLNFHSLNHDLSMLRERLGYALFREFGIAAPRAVHARLSINGKLEGLYALVEQIDGRFTHSRFSEGGDGNLYKEVWPASDSSEPYLAALRTNEDRDPSVDKLLKFERAVDVGTDVSLQWLDSQYLFDYIAADRVMINDDGVFHWHCSWNRNYYWYEAERSDRFWLVPWDLDTAFQNGTFVHLDAPWNAPATNCACGRGAQRAAVCDRLIGQWATRKEAYERSVDAFLAGPFAASNVDAKLEEWSAQIAPAVREAGGLHGAPSYPEWQDAFTQMKAIIAGARYHRGAEYGMPAPQSP